MLKLKGKEIILIKRVKIDIKPPRNIIHLSYNDMVICFVGN